MREAAYPFLRRSGPGTAGAIPRARSSTGARSRARWWGHLAWLGVFGVLGFAVSALFSRSLELERDLFVLAYLAAALPAMVGYLSWARVDVRGAVERRWKWGLLGALLAGSFVVVNVLGQEASPRPEGAALVGNLLWGGVVYGLLDAMFLSILPITMVWLGAKDLRLIASRVHRLGVAFAGLLGSLFVTVLYHWGFTEYHGSDIAGPVIGNGVLSLAYLLTTNPLASALAHVAMHVVSVLHGIDTTIQLPPHY